MCHPYTQDTVFSTVEIGDFREEFCPDSECCKTREDGLRINIQTQNLACKLSVSLPMCV